MLYTYRRANLLINFGFAKILCEKVRDMKCYNGEKSP